MLGALKGSAAITDNTPPDPLPHIADIPATKAINLTLLRIHDIVIIAY